MISPDAALESLEQIVSEFSSFIATKGAASEADTRVKLIDRILVEVCGWPEQAIKREEHVNSGFIDYSLFLQDRRYVAVEAKKEGSSFIFPDTASRTLKITGSLLSNKDVSEAISQVRGYCDDMGIRYAVATNGYAWVIFRAIREDIPWRDGTAKVFPSINFIRSNFTDFWNLLSYEAVLKGSLDEEFGASSRTYRELYRVVDNLYNADMPLLRNRLNEQLQPLLKALFEDIANQNPVEILRECYVYAKSLKVVAHDINVVLVDAVPSFLKGRSVEPVHQGEKDAGVFSEAIAQALTSQPGQLYLLLGGIGSGKTTFIKRYQRDVGKDVLDKHALWFHLDFLEAPVDPSDLERFAWEGVLYQLRQRYAALNLETRRNIKQAFADKIKSVEQTSRAYLMPPGAFERTIGPYLEKWQGDIVDYAPRLLRILQANRNIEIVLFIDNVDQLAPVYQAQVFTLAERITRTVGTYTVLAMREESYYTASLQKTLNAYTSRKFHIASPHFRKMIHNRIRFALKVVEHAQGPVDYVLPPPAFRETRGLSLAFLRSWRTVFSNTTVISPVS